MSSCKPSLVGSLKGHTGDIVSLSMDDYDEPGHTLISSSDDSTCRFWDLRSMSTSMTISLNSGDQTISCAGGYCSKISQYNVLISSENNIMLYDIRSANRCLSQIKLPDDINQFSTNKLSDNDFVFAPCDDGKVCVNCIA